MEKWSIRPSPTSFDPLRHVLLVKGSMKDVSILLRRFGALCGRPTSENTPEGFNYSLPLHGVTTATMEHLSAALNEMSGTAPKGGVVMRSLPEPGAMTSLPPAPAPAFGDLPSFGAPTAAPAPIPLPTLPAAAPPPLAAPAPAAVDPFSMPPAGGLPPMPSFAAPPASTPAPAASPFDGGASPFGAPAASPFGAPPSAAFGALPPAAAPAPVLAPAPEASPFGAPSASPFGAPPAPEPAALPAAAPPVVESAPQLVSLAPEPAAALPAPAAAPVPAPAPAPEPVPAAVAGVVASAASKTLFGLLEPFDAQQTFDSLLVGPYNRFAHAAATSVVSAPGTMYNPLFLYGAPGVGKTHFLHSIAKGLGGVVGDEAVVLTSGYRLSNAVSQALAAGRFQEIQDHIGKAKALVIDSVHLMGVTDQNKGALAEIMAHFFSNNLQVVLSSIYPARALGALEEALKISLAKGWAVDLKVPGQMVQVDIVQAWMDRHSLQLTTDDARMFHDRLSTNYAEVLVWMKRLITLSKFMQQKGQEQKPSDLLNVLFDPGVAAADFPGASDLETTKNFGPPGAGPDAMALALIVPKGHENMAGWVASQFYSAASQHGVKQTYRHVLLSTYDAQQPFGVPFQIGESCMKAGAQAALVIGPPVDSQLAAKSGEFQHAVAHVLDSLDIVPAWIGHRGTMAPAPFLRAHLDFIASRLA